VGRGREGERDSPTSHCWGFSRRARYNLTPRRRRHCWGCCARREREGEGERDSRCDGGERERGRGRERLTGAAPRERDSPTSHCWGCSRRARYNLTQAATALLGLLRASGEGGGGRERLARRAPPAHKNAINVTNAVYSSPLPLFSLRTAPHPSPPPIHTPPIKTTTAGVVLPTTQITAGVVCFSVRASRRERLAASQPTERNAVYSLLATSLLSFCCASPPSTPPFLPSHPHARCPTARAFRTTRPPRLALLLRGRADLEVSEPSLAQHCAPRRLSGQTAPGRYRSLPRRARLQRRSEVRSSLLPALSNKARSQRAQQQQR